MAQFIEISHISEIDILEAMIELSDKFKSSFPGNAGYPLMRIRLKYIFDNSCLETITTHFILVKDYNDYIDFFNEENKTIENTKIIKITKE